MTYWWFEESKTCEEESSADQNNHREDHSLHQEVAGKLLDGSCQEHGAIAKHELHYYQEDIFDVGGFPGPGPLMDLGGEVDLVGLAAEEAHDGDEAGREAEDDPDGDDGVPGGEEGLAEGRGQHAGVKNGGDEDEAVADWEDEACQGAYEAGEVEQGEEHGYEVAELGGGHISVEEDGFCSYCVDYSD